MGNEGLGWDPLLKMVHNPGGHWHPVRGPHPRYTKITVIGSLIYLGVELGKL